MSGETGMTGPGHSGWSNIPQYKCHKVVRALKIATIDIFDGTTTITPENTAYPPFIVGPDWVAKHDAKAGGYFIVYQDGYTSWSPADAFEDGYTVIPQTFESVAAGIKPVPLPSQGRIVRYHHPGSLDGKYPPQTSPAIVQQVDPEDPRRCHLFVFGPKGQHMDWVMYGTGPSQWSWPTII